MLYQKNCCQVYFLYTQAYTTNQYSVEQAYSIPPSTCKTVEHHRRAVPQMALVRSTLIISHASHDRIASITGSKA